MVNTRILEQRIGWRHSGAAGPDGPDEAPRGLRHEPMLQGRVGAAARSPLPGPAGLAGGRARLARADIDATWAALPSFGDSLEAAVARHGRLPAIDRGAPAAAVLDEMRARVLRAMAERGWRRLGVASPRRGAGSTFLALGLAASTARLDYLHLLLIDLDLSRPALARHLGLTSAQPLAPTLTGEVPPLTALGRLGANLALAANGEPVSAAADLLHSPEAILALRAVAEALQPDLTIADLPPLLADPAAQAALPQVDAVLVVADGTRTTARDISECERALGGVVPLLGVVLNKSEDRLAPAGRD